MNKYTKLLRVKKLIAFCNEKLKQYSLSVSIVRVLHAFYTLPVIKKFMQNLQNDLKIIVLHVL